MFRNWVKRQLGGAAAGAVSGAVVGSIIPVVGTGIGAMIGALGGSTIGTIDLVSDITERKKSHPEETFIERLTNLYEDKES